MVSNAKKSENNSKVKSSTLDDIFSKVFDDYESDKKVQDNIKGEKIKTINTTNNIEKLQKEVNNLQSKIDVLEDNILKLKLVDGVGTSKEFNNLQSKIDVLEDNILKLKLVDGVGTSKEFNNLLSRIEVLEDKISKLKMVDDVGMSGDFYLNRSKIEDFQLPLFLKIFSDKKFIYFFAIGMLFFIMFFFSFLFLDNVSMTNIITLIFSLFFITLGLISYLIKTLTTRQTGGYDILKKTEFIYDLRKEINIAMNEIKLVFTLYNTSSENLYYLREFTARFEKLVKNGKKVNVIFLLPNGLDDLAGKIINEHRKQGIDVFIVEYLKVGIFNDFLMIDDSIIYIFKYDQDYKISNIIKYSDDIKIIKEYREIFDYLLRTRK